MDEQTMEKLIGLAKSVCKITWSGEETDRRVREIAEDAAVQVHHLLGMGDAPMEVFLEPGGERMLYGRYCLYEWNNMLEEFNRNYRSEILAQRHKYEVKHEKEKAT